MECSAASCQVVAPLMQLDHAPLSKGLSVSAIILVPDSPAVLVRSHLADDLFDHL